METLLSLEKTIGLGEGVQEFRSCRSSGAPYGLTRVNVWKQLRSTDLAVAEK
jgi:hypothetical protein